MFRLPVVTNCTRSGHDAHETVPEIIVESTICLRLSHLLGTKPPMDYTNRLIIVVVGKYPKLCGTFYRLGSQLCPFRPEGRTLRRNPCLFCGKASSICDTCAPNSKSQLHHSLTLYIERTSMGLNAANLPLAQDYNHIHLRNPHPK